MAIQNANRLDFYREDYKLKKNLSNLDFNSKVYIPNYFCFGEEEIRLSKKWNLDIKNFYKCGSIRTSNYFHHLNQNDIKIQKDKFDVCLISEPVPGLNSRMNRENLDLKGPELISILNIEKGLNPSDHVDVEIKHQSGELKKIKMLCLIDPKNELEYYKNVGILQYVLRNML